jgi:hypothetical protein
VGLGTGHSPWLSARPREPPACGARDGQHRTSTKRDRIAVVVVVVAKVIRRPSMMVRSTITVGMTAVPMVVAMMAMTIANVRGNESGRRAAASMAERRETNSIVWGLRSFGSYWPLGVFSLTAIPCRMHRISFDLRR